MAKGGKTQGKAWSKVRNAHSRKRYVIVTQPVLGAEYWVTQIFAMVQKKALFGFIPFITTDFYHPIVALIRNTKDEAYQLHAQIRSIVTHHKEEHWFAFLPAPTPPEGIPRRPSQDAGSL